jgi:hypothetical protein
MPKTRPPYSPEFRGQMVDLIRAGRDAADLARKRCSDKADHLSCTSMCKTILWGVRRLWVNG